MKILVTGSSGTIGTRLVEELISAGHDVKGADWVENKWQPAIEKKTTRVDLRDEKSPAKLPTDVELVVHLAANARVYELVENPERARDNFLTLFNALEYARKNGIQKFIFASSREGYGNIKADKLTEDMVRVENCESPYTASKVGGEALVHAYASCYDMDPVIIRFSNVYGMYDDSVRVVPLFIRQARAGEPMTVYGKNKCLDFTHIEDAVHGVMCIINNYDKAKNETFNLAYGEGTTIVDLAEKIKKILVSNSEIVMGEPRTGEVVRYVADISKAKKILGYSPKVSFEEGIQRSVEWYLKNT
jgi:UDP-glucose 4-epimerase